MDATKRLAHNLRLESSAYGYTLTIWGAGHVLIHVYEMPDAMSVLAYVAGALAGFAVLSAVAFDGPLTAVDEAEFDTGMTALSMVHVAATAGNLILVLAAADVLRAAGVPPIAAFGFVGVQSTVVYNASLLLEDFVSEALLRAFEA